MNIYYEGSKLPFNNKIDADLCKLNALKLFVKESDKFTGRLETDYLEGLDYYDDFDVNKAFELLDFMRLCEFFLIKEENPEEYRPIKNTSRKFCYQILFNMQQMYWRLFK